jgi:type VI secretion system secreted protein Hcp
VAAVDCFLSIKSPDVKGETLDQAHADMIECLSFNWGASNLGTAGTGHGAGAGAVMKRDLSITKYVDKASNVLAQACAAGTHFQTATLYLRKPSGDKPLDYLQYELGGPIFIAGYNISGDSGVIPVETIDINFTSLMITYNQQADTGGGSGPANLGWHFGKAAKM